ncbi:MAG: gamma-glutamyl-gamma-aminobutyrate hydrolase family protein, partial [Eubacteriales bacterium]|nr:gamma-glutamyl-gamma-aminobutyrate hydrolase family protein [Eubacteriales bacterium]
MRRRPMIGVVPLVDEERDSLWMVPGYLDGIRREGGLPVMLPLTEEEEELLQLAETMDGFLFTGGQDVSPRMYGEEPVPQCGDCCEARDRMEKRLLELVLERDIPALGICRGIQLLNVVLEGSLYQDLATQYPSRLNHHQAPPYDRPAHTVHVFRNTPLHQLLDREYMEVNSYHHQAIKTISPSLQPMAQAQDGLTEAVWVPGKAFLWAVQWHPEFFYRKDEDSRKIFRALV